MPVGLNKALDGLRNSNDGVAGNEVADSPATQKHVHNNLTTVLNQSV